MEQTKFFLEILQIRRNNKIYNFECKHGIMLQNSNEYNKFMYVFFIIFVWSTLFSEYLKKKQYAWTKIACS